MKEKESQKSDSLFLQRREVAESVNERSKDSGKSKLKIAAQKSISLVLRCYRMRWEADVSSDRPTI